MKNRYLRCGYAIVIVVCCINKSYSQGEANNWFFGNGAGITFNTDPPSAINGQLFTNEGCSSISTANGDLLFYTDGRSIWNANNQLMSNADYFGGTGLNGDPSSTSSGLIVPHPTQENLYYVFTVDEPHHDNAFAYPNQGPASPDGSPLTFYSDITFHQVPNDDDGFNNGFNYSIVDMNLNGGLGNVLPAQKNIELLTYNPNDPEEIKFKCGEKITAVKAEDCTSTWVITHFIDTFYAFKIDDNGINETPVTSQVGPVVPTSGYRRAAIGYLKASPDGTKLLTANQTTTYNAPDDTIFDGGDGNFYYFDFDNTTGIVSNPIELLTDINAYSVEFSSDGTKAYAAYRNNNSAEISQWDLTAPDIASTQFQFTNVNSLNSGALQLAPNGKIYFSRTGESILGVINNPNLLGDAADYSNDTNNGAISLGGNTATLGLPPFIQSIFEERIDITGLNTDNLSLCDGDTFTLFVEDIENVSYTWLKDNVVLSGENASSLDVSHPSDVTLPYQETYTLEIDFNDGSCPTIGLATIIYNPLPQTSNAFLSECTTNYENSSAEFNLTQAIPDILNGASPVAFNVFFFETPEDAQINENAIQNVESYTSIVPNQTITVAVESTETGCIAFANLGLEVVSFQFIDEFEPLKRCDNAQDGIQEFDLTEIETQEGILIDSYYVTENDALNQTNAIASPTSFVIQNPYQQNVFFRIDNGSLCDDLGVIALEVILLPDVQNTLSYYCVEDFPSPILIGTSVPDDEVEQFEYFWLDSEETTESILVNSLGNYEVAITNIATGCTNFETIEVQESGLAEAELIIEEFLEDNNSVTIVVSPLSLGGYEFSLNINGPYQDSNSFENLESGIYDVFIRDKNGCGITQKRFGILGIMDFFTPNGDGINDTWGFIGNFNNKQPLANVYIFDRYGKLLKNLIGLDQSWDGVYQGKPMPSQDYWYKIVLENGKTLVGNFSLIR